MSLSSFCRISCSSRRLGRPTSAAQCFHNSKKRKKENNSVITKTFSSYAFSVHVFPFVFVYQPITADMVPSFCTHRPVWGQSAKDCFWNVSKLSEWYWLQGLLHSSWDSVPAKETQLYPSVSKCLHIEIRVDIHTHVWTCSMLLWHWHLICMLYVYPLLSHSCLSFLKESQ